MPKISSMGSAVSISTPIVVPPQAQKNDLEVIKQTTFAVEKCIHVEAAPIPLLPPAEFK